MKETQKCFGIREDRKHFDLYLRGNGIDIGCGKDVLKIKDGTVFPWDTKEGDAQFMEGVEDNKYDFVYSSHCLEHFRSVETGLKNWIRILKPGGYLYFVVPEYVLYEKMMFPSMWNRAHRATFSYFITREKTNRNSHYHVDDIINLVHKLGARLVVVELEDHGFNYNLGPYCDQTMGTASAQILFVAQKKEK